MQKHVFDIEVYQNYFLIMFKSLDTGKINYLQMHDGVTTGDFANLLELLEFMKGITSIGFNSMNFDMPMVMGYLKRMKNQDLKGLCDYIIAGQNPHWKTARKYNLPTHQLDHIDIKEVAAGVMVSLKIYGGRIGSKRLQDLPIEPDAIITADQADELREYCINDLDTTEDLYRVIDKEVRLRETLSEKYGVEMRSKSDAQMAEAIFRNYLEAEGVHVGKRVEPVLPFKYRVPDWVSFDTPELQAVLDTVRACTFSISEKGAVVLPAELSKAIPFHGAKYKFGIGGLHSQEKKQVVIPNSDQLFGEYDISGMYPNIIIEQGSFPAHLSPKFLTVYKGFVDARSKMKIRLGEIKASCDPSLNGEKAELEVHSAAYKIIANGSYGKFGSKYSYLYSPELLIQTTITGQLFLLMSIEKVVAAGGIVRSANTDGINVLVEKADHGAVEAAIMECELLSGYDYEYTPYSATYSRDVNSYIAIKPDGIKGKGAFAIGGLMKNPTNVVCTEAVIAHITNGAPIADTIRAETDIKKFLTVRQVTGGAVFRGELLGKAIRFYHAVDGETIHYAKNGNKVPKSDGCKPLMTLPDEMPVDIDYEWYIADATSQLEDLGLAQ